MFTAISLGKLHAFAAAVHITLAIVGVLFQAPLWFVLIELVAMSVNARGAIREG